MNCPIESIHLMHGLYFCASRLRLDEHEVIAILYHKQTCWTEAIDIVSEFGNRLNVYVFCVKESYVFCIAELHK